MMCYYTYQHGLQPFTIFVMIAIMFVVCTFFCLIVLLFMSSSLSLERVKHRIERRRVRFDEVKAGEAHTRDESQSHSQVRHKLQDRAQEVNRQSNKQASPFLVMKSSANSTTRTCNSSHLRSVK
jgi:biopolymer transport protein ExbB/TolQ